MKIIIDAEVKEITALVSSLQERCSEPKTVELELYPTTEFESAIRDMHGAIQKKNVHNGS